MKIVFLTYYASTIAALANTIFTLQKWFCFEAIEKFFFYRCHIEVRV